MFDPVPLTVNMAAVRHGLQAQRWTFGAPARRAIRSSCQGRGPWSVPMKQHDGPTGQPFGSELERREGSRGDAENAEENGRTRDSSPRLRVRLIPSLSHTPPAQREGPQSARDGRKIAPRFNGGNPTQIRTNPVRDERSLSPPWEGRGSSRAAAVAPAADRSSTLRRERLCRLPSLLFSVSSASLCFKTLPEEGNTEAQRSQRREGDRARRWTGGDSHLVRFRGQPT